MIDFFELVIARWERLRPGGAASHDPGRYLNAGAWDDGYTTANAEQWGFASDDGHYSQLTPADLCGFENLALAPPGSDGMTISLGGMFYGLGIPDLDSDCNGISDSVTLTDETGLTVYSDRDGDGIVDFLTTVRFDGGYVSWVLSEESVRQVESAAETIAGPSGIKKPEKTTQAGLIGKIDGENREPDVSGSTAEKGESGTCSETWATDRWTRVGAGSWGSMD